MKTREHQMMKKQSKYLKRLLIFGYFIFVPFTLFFVTSLGRADAVTGDAANILPSDGTNIVVSADTCAQCFYSPTSINYLYVPIPNPTATVTLLTSSKALSSFSIGAVIAGICTPLNPDNTLFSPRNNNSITISTNQQATQQTITGDGVQFKVFCVQVQTLTGSNVTFKLSTSAGNLLGTYPGPAADQGTGYFANSGADWSEAINFAPACGQATNAGNIILYDLDNPYSQRPNIRVYLTRYNKDGTGATAMSMSGDVQGPVDGFGGQETVDGGNGYSWTIVNNSGYSDAYKYQLQLVGIGSDNKIRIRLPYDQVYSAFDGSCGNLPSGSVTANCSVVTGTFSDKDHAGPYQIDIHFKDGPPGYTNTYTTQTNAANNFSFTIPDQYKGYNGGGSTKVWIDGLGKDTLGNNKDWQPLAGSPLVFGPCTDAACSLIDYDLGSGFTGTGIANGGVITAHAGDVLTVKVGWKNPSTTGGTSWTNLGTNVGGAYNAGWDISMPAPLNSSGGYNPSPSARLRAENQGSTVAPGETGIFYWDVGALTSTNSFDQIFRMVHENPNGEWFGGACSFKLKIGYSIITAGTIVNCDLTPSTGFVEVGEQFNGTYNVRYQPTGSPAYYPTIHVTNPRFSVTPGYPSRVGNPADFTMAPQAGGSSEPINFSPPPYVLNNTGVYALHGVVHIEADDGFGGKTSFDRTCDDSKTVGHRPYVRVYGADVVAGGSFTDPCTTVSSSITASSKVDVNGNWIGAGTQFGAMADGSITGFATAALFAPAAPMTLAFANTTSSPPVIGGSFGAQFCANNYWPTSLPALGSTVIDASTSGRFRVPAGSTITQTQPLVYSTTIYVDGDVTIGSDLLTTSSWNSTLDIPSLYIIARGNIYIKDTVTQLDGFFVAQPTATTPSVAKGRIFTCYNTNDADTDSLFLATKCNKKLLINGALLAAKVNFLRINGTVSSGVAAEGAGSGNIAEVIQFIPELLMSKPALGPETLSSKIDSILSLSPSL